MLERHKRELLVVAVNDMADLHTNGHLFRYDSSYGAFPGKVEVGEGRLRIDDLDIVVLSEKDRHPCPGLSTVMLEERWPKCSLGTITNGLQLPRR